MSTINMLLRLIFIPAACPFRDSVLKSISGFIYDRLLIGRVHVQRSHLFISAIKFNEKSTILFLKQTSFISHTDCDYVSLWTPQYNNKMKEMISNQILINEFVVIKINEIACGTAWPNHLDIAT